MKVAIDTIPPFVMGFLRFVPAGLLLACAVALRQPAARSAGPPAREVRRRLDRRHAAAPRRHGPRGLGRADDPVRHRRAADRPDADVARDLRPGCSSASGCRAPAVVGIAVGLVGVAILAWPHRGVGDARPGRPARAPRLARAAGRWARCTRRGGPCCRRPPCSRAASRWSPAASRCWRSRRVTGELGGFDLAAVSTPSWAGLAYLLLVGSLVGYTTYAWLLDRGAAAAGRHLRLREPGRRRVPRRA